MPFDLTPEFLSRTINGIYDSAIDPGTWVDTLTALRDAMGLAYVQLFFAAPPQDPMAVRGFLTEWDEDWTRRLLPLLPQVPGIALMRGAEVDSPLAQLQVVEAEEFQASQFYQTWVRPQGLCDACNTTVLRRPTMEAWFSGTTPAARGAFTDTDLRTFQLLAPHIRRALLIADMVDEGRFQLALHRMVLNQLSSAVFMVEADGRIVLTNTRAETLLEDRRVLTDVSRRLRPVSVGLRDGFETALRRVGSESADLGTWGNGLALPGPDGAGAVAYLLPLGQSDRRRALGPGQVAVFVTDGQGSQPPGVEALSAVTGLTLAEARVALAVAEGAGPEAIAASQGISVHTVRKHLSNINDKTGLTTQAQLGAHVNRFRLPLR